MTADSSAGSQISRREAVQRTSSWLLAAAALSGARAAETAANDPKIVWGIAELFEWIYRLQKSTGHDTEDCLQAHLDHGIRHVIWAIGRSTVDYHSKLPASTLYVGDSRPETKIIGEVLKQRCTLRAAMAFARERGMTIYARLCMNRHYGSGYGGALRSRWAAEHPELWFVTKKGKPDPTRLSYFFPEYRRERIAILAEVAAIGPHGLCLDFCRQVPHMDYQPKLIAAWQAKSGGDPHALKPGDPGFMEWCRFRAGYVTAFLRELRAALGDVEKRLGHRVPVMARITDCGLDVNLMEGMDVETWLKEKLVDELCTNPLWWLHYKYPDTLAPYAKLARAHGVKLWGGVGCLPAAKTRVNPVSFLRRVQRQYGEGANGMALYQSDTGIRYPILTPYLPQLGDAAAVARWLGDKELLARWPQDDASRCYGLDNHSKIEALGATAQPMENL
ncbi:MAG: hypothetical protein WC740_04560 [Verrucomicrobiia bacterium]